MSFRNLGVRTTYFNKEKSNPKKRRRSSLKLSTPRKREYRPFLMAEPSKPKGLKYIPTESNGDCFYEAVVGAIISAPAKVRNTLTDNILRKKDPENVGKVNLKWSPDLIRSLVALEVLSKDPIVDGMITQFHQCYKEAYQNMGKDKDDANRQETLHIFKHFKGSSRWGRLLSDKYRTKLYHRLDDRTCYWADNMAIIILETLFNVKVLVLEEKGQNLFDEEGNQISQKRLGLAYIADHGNEFYPDYYILVRKVGVHYEGASIKGERIFSFSKIPDSLRDMASMDYSKVEFRYISLKKRNKKKVKKILRK